MKPEMLLVYPHNLFMNRMGIDARFNSYLDYFNSRGYVVDLLTLKNFVSSWDERNVVAEKKVRHIYFYDFLGGRREARKIGRAFSAVKRKVKDRNRKEFSCLPDYAFRGMKKQFRSIVSDKHYDFVFISYVYWAGLLEPEWDFAFWKILDLSDFITLNLFDMTAGKVAPGVLLEEEIRRVNLFDHVLCISDDEKKFFSGFCKKPEFHLIPHFLQPSFAVGVTGKYFDLLFIGSDNPFNIKGLAWFFEQVFPLLDKELRLRVVGKISAHVPADLRDRVQCIEFAEDLSAVYADSKVAVCPMLGGTGIKIKVVEALAYGLPVVTSPKGIIGFPQKHDNGCLVAKTPKEFAESIHTLLNSRHTYCAQQELARSFFLKWFAKNRVQSKLDCLFPSASKRA